MSANLQNDPSKNLNQFNKFLQNNVDFLKQKYVEHFQQPFAFHELQTKAKIQIGIKFIYDVFSFQKYQKDPKMNATLRKSLRQNIIEFIKVSGQKQAKQFDAEEAIKLLKYCIQNNEMFAVHYDKKQNKPKEPVGQQEKTPQIVQNNEDTNQKVVQNQEALSPITSVQQKIIKNDSNISKPKQKNQQNVDKKDNEFEMQKITEDQKVQLETLKKQAKTVFQFYCKQQLNSGGPNATFDKILHQTTTMTLGKFMAFANTTGILYTTKVQAYKPKNQAILDKRTLNQSFRRFSKGQKQIDFDQFFELIKTLNQVDSSVYQKLHMNKDETLNKIVRKLKYLNAPFAMKGPFSKDIQTNVDQKPYIPITTGHSGKFQTCLKQDIEDRRQKLRLLPHQPYPNPNQIKISYFNINESSNILSQSLLRQSKILQQDLFQSKIKGPNHFLSQRKAGSKTTMNQKKQVSKIHLQNSKISFQKGEKLFNDNQMSILQNLIVHDEENDDEFLKDYKIPKLSSNAGLIKKSNHLSLLNRRSQQSVQPNRRYSGMKTERKNVVDELKQRIKQVQKNQRKQLSSLQNKRKAVSNYNNKY